MEINAIGQACPMPVIRTKQAIEANPGEMIEILVDNLIATENLQKLADNMGLDTEVIEESSHVFRVRLSGTPINLSKPSPMMKDNGFVVAISADEMGSGDGSLGRQLLKGFIYALGEQDELPKKVIFYNRGVMMTTTEEKSIEDLKALESRGVEILSCGLCLDFYELKSQLAVGEATNMYHICEILSSHRVVRP